jgi:hypothetical protein
MISYNSPEDNVSNLVHQTLHVLGFHTNLYQFWAKPNGVTDITPAVSIRNKSTFMLVTDGVKASVQAEFGIASVDGLELDVGDNCNLPGSNWEKRVMANDIMTRGWDLEGTILSKITLAAMGDTGWYDVVSGAGQAISFGYNQGVDFMTEDCVKPDTDPKDMEVPAFEEFCSDWGRITGCNHSHTHVGRCNLTKYSRMVTPAYRYYKDPFMGGADSYLDYCPVVQPYLTGDCRDSANQRYADLTCGETFGANSRCVEGTFVT